jgi:hypothetical protein
MTLYVLFPLPKRHLKRFDFQLSLLPKIYLHVRRQVALVRRLALLRIFSLLTLFDNNLRDQMRF